ncbi:MAG: tape measure protein [Alistipes sp.]|nr:tape measure protein [Alistipes sp.]
MNNQDGKTYFSLGIKNAQLQRDAEQAIKIFNGIGDEAEREGKRIDETFKNIGKAAAAYFTATQIWEFGKSVVNARKEIESFEISFSTLLGSEPKAKAFFAEIKDFAVKTPLQLNDIAGAAQTLLGFGISAEKIMPILRQLGDVSMGNAERFKSLALAFAQATSAGKLQGQDLLQMINAGFNPLNEIAKKTGKSIGQLKDDMSKGKISAQDLADALASATAQGGQFYGMLEKQSKGIEGALSNLEGAWNDALNEIGTSAQGVFTDAIGLATAAVQNYDVFIKTILSLAAAYGTYKAVLMATYVIQKSQVLIENIRLVMMFRKELGLLTAAQQAFNLTALKNPYILLASVIVGTITALVLFNKKEDETAKVIDECNEKIKQQEAALEELKNRKDAVLEAEKEATKSTADQINQIEILNNTIHDETASIDDRRKAIKQMQSIVPKYHAELDDEGRLHRENKKAIDEHIESLNRLALAKALQAKREELVAQRVNAELDRRAAKKEETDAQRAVDAAQAERDEAERRFNARPGQAANQTNTGQMLLGGREMRMVNASADRYDRNQSGLTAAENELRAANAKLAEMKGEVRLADERIAAAKEDIAVLDEMMKDYDEELKKIASGKVTTTVDPKEAKRFANYTSLQEKQAVEAARAAKDMEFAVEQSRIDAMAEGSEKILAQMKLDHAKEQEELEREKADYLQRKIDNAKAAFEANPANKDKVFDGSGITLTKGENDAFEARKQNLAKKQSNDAQNLVAEQKRLMNEYLKDYGTYLEKRNAIIALYNEQIANATSEGEKLSLAAQMREDLSELDIEANKTTAAISQLFGDMTNKTVADMRKIADAAQNALDFLIAGEWDEQKGLEFGMTKETFDTLRKSPEELEKIRKGIRECREEADAAEGAFNKMGNGLKKLFAAGNDAGKTKQALSEIEAGLSQVLDLASFLSDTFASLGDAFGNDTLSGIAEGINVAMDAVNSTMAGAQAGSMFGPIGAAAGAAIGLVSSLASSIAKIHDKKNEKRIQQLQTQIETLERSYEKLGRSIEKAYSKDASKMIEQQNTLLAQQKLLIQQQIAEEKDKKETDWGRIEEWENQIEEIDQLIADNKEKAVDAIFGEDLKSAIDNFSSAYAEAWASGGDKAKSAKEVVKKMMQQMVTESIKAAIQSSGKMEEIRQKLQQFYADNVLSGWEQDYIYNMAEQLQAELDEKFGWADGLMGGDDESQREGVKKGIATASQESVDENNARLTTMQGHTYTLVQNSNENKAHLAASREHLREIRELANTSIKHLEDISRNTYQLYETNKRLKRVEDELSDINTKGVVIRKA